jgi:hypothetical protein
MGLRAEALAGFDFERALALLGLVLAMTSVPCRIQAMRPGPLLVIIGQYLSAKPT